MTRLTSTTASWSCGLRSFGEHSTNLPWIADAHSGTLTTNMMAAIGMPRWHRGEFLAGMTSNPNTQANRNAQANTSAAPSADRGSPAPGADGANAPAGNRQGGATR